jgi:acyl dehydratase
MSETKTEDFEKLRQRWEDGSMSGAEFNGVLDDYLAEDAANKAGSVAPVPLTWETTYSFPVNEHLVTEDHIKRYAFATGDFNPLYRDSEYAKRSLHGGVIAPPIFQAAAANSPTFPDKPQIPGLNSFYGGTENIMYKVMRPGDRIHVVCKYLGIEEKKDTGKPYRLFVPRGQKLIYNDRGELMGKSTGNEIWMAMPPGSKKKTEKADKNPFAGRTRPRYTPEQLDEIHRFYDDEMAGKFRRGAEIRYWEDVTEGEEINPLIRGPLDVSDTVSWIVAAGYSIAFGWKWNALKGDLDRCLIDPDTGAPHNAIDWHYVDNMAQVAGLPYAHSIGRQNEAIVACVLSNWMGDDGFVKRLYCAHRATWFLGETITSKAKTKRKYVEDNEHLIDLDAWNELPDGTKTTVAEATIKLRSRTD